MSRVRRIRTVGSKGSSHGIMGLGLPARTARRHLPASLARNGVNMSDNSLDRRDFLKATGALTASSAFAKSSSKLSSRVIGANDRINIGVIGCGGRGNYDAQAFARYGQQNKDTCQVVAVCDVYEK